MNNGFTKFSFDSDAHLIFLFTKTFGILLSVNKVWNVARRNTTIKMNIHLQFITEFCAKK